jgi:hypothetical protein
LPGRIRCAIELEPRFVHVAIARWDAQTGRTARRA